MRREGIPITRNVGWAKAEPCPSRGGDGRYGGTLCGDAKRGCGFKQRRVDPAMMGTRRFAHPTDRRHASGDGEMVRCEDIPSP